jgi:hypothetical protein
VTEIRTGLTYDDVLLVPRRSRVRSRQDVSTRSSFTPKIALEVPIVSANMDTVTTAPMAVAMAQLGGIGVLHRFLPVEEEAADVRKVKRYLTHVVGEPYVIEPDRTVGHARAEAQRLRERHEQARAKVREWGAECEPGEQRQHCARCQERLGKLRGDVVQRKNAPRDHDPEDADGHPLGEVECRAVARDGHRIALLQPPLVAVIDQLEHEADRGDDDDADDGDQHRLGVVAR